MRTWWRSSGLLSNRHSRSQRYKRLARLLAGNSSHRHRAVTLDPHPPRFARLPPPALRARGLHLSRLRDHCKTSSPSKIALILSELASSPSRAASRPPQDEDAARRTTLAPQREEVSGDLILRCEGEARASKDEVIYYAMIPQAGEVRWHLHPLGLRPHDFSPPRAGKEAERQRTV